MRRSRIGIRKKRKRAKRANIVIALLFLFILPITAIAIGSRITQWWVVPTINTDSILEVSEKVDIDEKDEVENNLNKDIDNNSQYIEKEIVDLNPISIYMIQIASITDKANVTSLIKELSNYKYPHFVHETDDVYKIYMYVSTRREDVETKIDEVKQIYSDAYIGHIYVPSKQVHYLSEENSGTEEVVENINLLLELLDRYSNSIYKLNDENKETDEYKKVLEDYTDVLLQLNKIIDDNDINLPKEFASVNEIKNMIKFQKKNITKSFEIFKNNGKVYELQNYCSDNLFNIVELIGS